MDTHPCPGSVLACAAADVVAGGVVVGAAEELAGAWDAVGGAWPSHLGALLLCLVRLSATRGLRSSHHQPKPNRMQMCEYTHYGDAHMRRRTWKSVGCAYLFDSFQDLETTN